MSVFDAVAAEQVPHPLTPAPAEQPSRGLADPKRRLVRVWAVTLGIILALILAGGGTWLATGGRYFVVSTASMSPVLPVGALALDRPFAASKVRVGTIISFHPPYGPARVYSHRVIAITAAGYKTQGDVEPNPDPWIIPQHNVLGIVVQGIPGLGWLVLALPWLVIGLLVALALAAWVPWRWGVFIPLVTTVVVIVVPIIRFRPLVNGLLLFSYPSGKDVVARVINTGLLPMRFRAGDQTWVRVAGGHWTDLRLKAPPNGVQVDLVGKVDLGLIGWIILITICLLPLILGIIVTIREWRLERRGELGLAT